MSQKTILIKIWVDLFFAVPIFFFIFLIPLHCFSLNVEQEKCFFNVKDKLNLIPEGDKKSLNDFFTYLITESCFAYTLFGDKPTSFQEFTEDLNKINLEMLQHSYSDYFLSHGWEIWEKHCHLFPHPHFIFKKMRSLSGYHFIVIINKKVALNMIERNLDYFKKILGNDITTIALLNQFDTQDTSLVFENLVKNDQVLIGILLGFGKENSLIFQERDRLGNQLIKSNTSPLLSQKHKEQLTVESSRLLKCFKSKDSIWNHEKNLISYSSLCKKLNQIQEETGHFLHPAKQWVAKVGEPQFSCLKNGVETQGLRTLYKINLTMILQSCLLENLLETTLNQLCHE